MKRSLFIASFLFSVSLVLGQEFSRKDSLRGQWSPARASYDVGFYDLSVDVDPERKALYGEVIMRIKALETLDSIQVDLYENMELLEVTYGGEPLFFKREFDAVWLYFSRPIPKDYVVDIRMEHQGIPVAAKRAPWDGGLVWRTDAQGRPWIGVAVEGDGASLWWPNKDHLADEPDSMMIRLTVPKGLVAVANGNCVDTLNLGDKQRYDWKVSHPINNYNVTLNIAHYSHFSRTYKGLDGPLDLDFYVLDYNLEKAQTHFNQVEGMLDCFEDLFGAYPFYRDGYALVETPYLGMEHQSAIAYGNKYLPGYMGMRPPGIDFDYIIIHETGHEWWGNSVSMKDLADMWIHESFCTYSEALYVECLHGRDEMQRYLNFQRPFITNDSPILGHYGVNHHGNSTDMYYKGSWMLHSLRSLVNNDSLWLSCIKGLALQFRHQTVDRDQVIQYMEQTLGMDLQAIMDQYQKHSKLPVLEYEYVSRGWFGYQLRYRWKTDVEGFSMESIWVDEAGNALRLPTNNQWRSLKIKAKDRGRWTPNLDLLLIKVLNRAELQN